MFTPNRVKEIRSELTEIVALLNDKQYIIALVCCHQVANLNSILISEIKERSQANGKAESRDRTAETGQS